MPIEIPPTPVAVTVTTQQAFTATHGYIDGLTIDGKGKDASRTRPTLSLTLTPYAEDQQGNRTYASSSSAMAVSDAYAAAQYVPQIAAAEVAIFTAAQAMLAYRQTVRQPVVDAATALMAQRTATLNAAKAAIQPAYVTLYKARNAVNEVIDSDRPAAVVAAQEAEAAWNAANAAAATAEAALTDARALLDRAKAAVDDIALPPVVLPQG